MVIVMMAMMEVKVTCARRTVEEGDSVEPDLLGVDLLPGQGQADGDGGHQVPLHAGGEDQALPGGDMGEREEQEKGSQEQEEQEQEQEEQEQEQEVEQQ